MNTYAEYEKNRKAIDSKLKEFKAKNKKNNKKKLNDCLDFMDSISLEIEGTVKKYTVEKFREEIMPKIKIVDYIECEKVKNIYYLESAALIMTDGKEANIL